MPHTGKLIVIEGLDGSGKATQAALLLGHLRELGTDAVQVSFPDYGSRSSALVKMYLAGEVGRLEEVNVYAASSFYAADRYISYQTNWKRVYQAGAVIIADRYATSNAAHQMSKLPRAEWKGYLDWLWDYEYNRLGLPAPDAVVYLDMPPAVSRRLLEKRYGGDSGKKDLHESDFGYQLSCREAALYAAKKLGWAVLDCCGGGEEPLPVDEIAARVRELAL